MKMTHHEITADLLQYYEVNRILLTTMNIVRNYVECCARRDKPSPPADNKTAKLPNSLSEWNRITVKKVPPSKHAEYTIQEHILTQFKNAYYTKNISKILI